MELIADLHLHSKYSRAVSKWMDLDYIADHARRKGIGLVATGDWQHPAWFSQIEESLVEIRPGIFSRKSEAQDPAAPRFLLSTELSCIYTEDGKGRRIHHLVFSPSLETCRKVISCFQERGFNLLADGRPILPISSSQLVSLLKEIDPLIEVVPAHVWTPWFGMLGSKTGYDSLEACFGENASSIHAIETGLSSDPAMNWRIKEFENRQVVSFSDAHSGPKMGREATVFEGKENYEYNDLIGALAGELQAGLKIVYTIEYFPEEGKYHWTGHRECDVCYSPDEERAKGLVCPVCGRQLTSGVEHRVDVLATKPKKVSFSLRGELLYGESEQKAPFVSMIPLLEILQEVLKSKAKSEREYTRLTELAPEFEWLLRMSLPEIEKDGGEVLAKAIASVRKREVVIKPGFDGVFGSVTIPQ